MSIYYQFRCNKCGKTGGFFSCQAWGWGNMDIIETFKFLALHTERCGEGHLRVIAEYDDNYHLRSPAEEVEFITETEGMFPYSDDWEVTYCKHEQNPRP